MLFKRGISCSKSSITSQSNHFSREN